MNTNASMILAGAHDDGIPTPGTGCTSADAVALLGRVNFSSVVRIFAAIEAIKAAGHTVDTSIASIPRECLGHRVDPNFSSPRAQATQSFARTVALHPNNQPLWNYLHLGRFYVPPTDTRRRA